ncbi:TRAP-type C4-dicarboxylate transport system substrate-binding protein [Lipingzhangella halophila]|uniref:TRAP-type C4-dicarboxylate transport system substrate-binding protein n=1 Tax=Lipingzhangella halophila TaxID=1783352 RepID=A0A7W7RGQ3_9ACTN|nr:TRAP transporter substrate-binding protein DctP [Lipingzhangella halophila]MBB4931121.1 TRAP-type C4-dicarboxylate transport system substrate-binding protein [Lipingzhangella halophila]
MTRHQRFSRYLMGTGALVASGALLTGCGLASGPTEDGEVTLRLSHQWPAPEDGEGDFRAVLAQRFADQVEERTDGDVTVEISPNNSLIEDPTEQYSAIRDDTLDMSVFPLDYAAGDVPEFSMTLMPSMVRNHAQAQNWQDSEIGDRISQTAEDNGVRILTWVWNAGAIGTAGDEPIRTPDDVPSGSVTRAAGPKVEEMLEGAGFGLSSMPSSDIYNALQTGTLDSAITSTTSFSSYRLYEQVNTFTSPAAGNTFWFMFEPLIIGTDAYDQLTEEQQTIVDEVGADIQEFAYTASEEDDQRVHEEFEENGVEVVEMSDSDFEEWREISEPAWESFGEEVEGGEELIELGQEVPAE